MQFPKLPGNVYSYRASIFGIPIREALAVSVVASISILTVRIDFYIPILTALVIPLFFIYRNKQRWTVNFHKNKGSKGKPFKLLSPISVRSINGDLYVQTKKIASLLFEMKGLNLLAMRTNTQKTIIDVLRKSVEDSQIDLDIFSIHREVDEEKRKKTIYRTIIRFSRDITGAGIEKCISELKSHSTTFQASLSIPGLYPTEITDEADLQDISLSLLH